MNMVRHSLIIARRNLMKIAGNPGLILDATVMPMVFAVVFVYVLGGAIADSTRTYQQFFMPGIMALTLTIVSRSTGISLAVDFGNGMVDRLRSLPIARSAVLTGRIIADTVRMLVSLLIIFSFAYVIGFRIETNVVSSVAALGLLTAYGVALCWVAAFIGLAVRSIQTVESVTMLWMVPLQFGSSLFVPTDTMPGWLAAFAEVNPMTLVVDASRGLLLGPVLGSDHRVGRLRSQRTDPRRWSPAA
ncbi:ABC transporter permease [Parafrankia sp. FMc2]|uniref:ABC transporter permease n=1 Tax=Parafrankia sp. FMc2 TaxID=3233196 RepID=UPI003B585A57